MARTLQIITPIRTSIGDCPEPYSKLYCLNGATCFSVRINNSSSFNCWCPAGFYGLRCDFKYVRASSGGNSQVNSQVNLIQSKVISSSKHHASVVEDKIGSHGAASIEHTHQDLYSTLYSFCLYSLLLVSLLLLMRYIRQQARTWISYQGSALDPTHVSPTAEPSDLLAPRKPSIDRVSKSESDDKSINHENRVLDMMKLTQLQRQATMTNKLDRDVSRAYENRQEQQFHFWVGTVSSQSESVVKSSR